MRREPDLPTTIVGRPPMEDFYLGHATERIFLPLLKLTIPEIVDYHMPAEGIFHNLVFVSIKKEYPGQAYKVMNAMWGQGLMSLAKVLVVVDMGERAQSAGGVVGGAQQHRSRARCAVHDGPGGRARSLEPRVHVRLQDGSRRDAQTARRKDSRASGRRSSRWTTRRSSASTRCGRRSAFREPSDDVAHGSPRGAKGRRSRIAARAGSLREFREAAAHACSRCRSRWSASCSRRTARR